MKLRLPFFSRPKKEEMADAAPSLDEYHEMPHSDDEQKQVKIVIEKLEGYAYVDKIIRRVREGNVVIVKIKELKEQNMDELKQAVNRMKTLCENMHGDIAGVGDEWVLLTPPAVLIDRGI